jgi:hypothetical protein
MHKPSQRDQSRNRRRGQPPGSMAANIEGALDHRGCQGDKHDLLGETRGRRCKADYDEAACPDAQL